MEDRETDREKGEGGGAGWRKGGKNAGEKLLMIGVTVEPGIESRILS